jgi:hypothetical protein
VATCYDDLISLARLRRQGFRNPVLILCWQPREVVRNRFLSLLRFGETAHGYWRFPFRLIEAIKVSGLLRPMSQGNLETLQRENRSPTRRVLRRVDELLTGLAQHQENVQQTVIELEAIRNGLLQGTSVAMHRLVAKYDGSGMSPLYLEMEACIGRLRRPSCADLEYLVARLRFLFDEWAEQVTNKTLETPRDS